jgi:sortase A
VHAYSTALVRDGTEPVAPALPLGLELRPMRRMSRIRRTIREIGLSLITAGVVVLLFVLYGLVGTNVAEARSQNHLRKAFSTIGTASSDSPAIESSSGGVKALGLPEAPPSGAVAHLVIPKIGVDKIVVEGVELSDLQKGPGHYPRTPLPGEPGNAAIAGHRTTYGAPFYRLNELASGDDIFVTTPAGKFRYQVTDSRVVGPSDVSVLNPTADNRLTLTTCNPRFSAAQRLVVVSKLAGLPLAPPITGTVSAGIPTAEPTIAPAPRTASLGNLGHGDAAAWLPMILYGLLAVALWIAVRVLGAHRRRWRRLEVYLPGIVACLVPLWYFFENVVRLLPQSI